MPGYRDRALRCPLCASALEAHEVGGAVIDLCSGCAGLWVDWYDGTLEEVAANAPTRSSRRASSSEAAANECPRCGVALHEERIAPAEIEILRCGECAGAFVTRDACDDLVKNARPALEPDDRSLLERVSAALNDLLFGS